MDNQESQPDAEQAFDERFLKSRDEFALDTTHMASVEGLSAGAGKDQTEPAVFKDQSGAEAERTIRDAEAAIFGVDLASGPDHSVEVPVKDSTDTEQSALPLPMGDAQQDFTGAPLRDITLDDDDIVTREDLADHAAHADAQDRRLAEQGLVKVKEEASSYAPESEDPFHEVLRRTAAHIDAKAAPRPEAQADG